jgi:hypothetical protein
MEITGSEEDSDIVSNLFVIIYIYTYNIIRKYII